MLTINKDNSYKVAEAVLACFMIISSDCSDVEGDVYVSIQMSTVGGYSALRLTRDTGSKEAKYV